MGKKIKLGMVIGGFTYEKFAEECHKILAPEYNIDIFTVSYFNIYTAWIKGLSVNDVVGICLGTKDTDIVFPSAELEFVDDFQGAC